ncbi:MAG: single-stranded-DNA-specific exonuclease RecJ [Chloroflexota bacterium]
MNHNKRWLIPPPLTPEQSNALSRYPQILKQVLVNRGCTTEAAALQYLEAHTPAGCAALSMLGVFPAVERIQRAIRSGESIVIYGDYDVDGVTATALMVQALGCLGGQVRGYIPNRFDEGYGLNVDALEALHAEGAGLVITVDCGIRSPAEAAYARRIGLDLIITDHHVPGDELPEAVSVINPKQSGDSYPDKHLAGVGLAYKLVCGLYELESGRTPPLEELLDLVALGTIADLAPLTGENRALVRLGLQQLRFPRRQGVLSLLGVANLAPAQVNSEQISFSLGPRLNAAGRLDTAMAALDLLLTNDVQRTGTMAQELEIRNRERQQLTREVQADAERRALEGAPEELLLFAASPAYNPGIIGLAASRLTDQYYRPAIVAAQGEEFTRGSCRSIPEFNITEALDQCADLLVKHGGHAVAAGFTVSNANLPELVARLKDIARRQLGELELRPTLRADLEAPLYELKPALLDYLAWLQPTGQENPPAVFVSRGLRVIRSGVVGKDQAHLKLVVSDGRVTFDAIAFRLGHLHNQLPQKVDLLYLFEKNEYNGRTSLQLNVRDLRPSDAA